MGGEFELQRKLAARNDLTARAGFEVDDDWRLQIEREGSAVLPDDEHDLGLPAGLPVATTAGGGSAARMVVILSPSTAAESSGCSTP